MSQPSRLVNFIFWRVKLRRFQNPLKSNYLAPLTAPPLDQVTERPESALAGLYKP
jgi:hypothetical protein